MQVQICMAVTLVSTRRRHGQRAAPYVCWTILAKASLGWAIHDSAIWKECSWAEHLVCITFRRSISKEDNRIDGRSIVFYTNAQFYSKNAPAKTLFNDSYASDDTSSTTFPSLNEGVTRLCNIQHIHWIKCAWIWNASFLQRHCDAIMLDDSPANTHFCALFRQQTRNYAIASIFLVITLVLASVLLVTAYP